MTALASMKLSTTQLTDLPGNKVSRFGGTKQSFQVHKHVHLKPRHVVASEHFVKASDQESSSEEESSDEDDEEELMTSRSLTYQSQINQDKDILKPFKASIPNKIIPPRTLMSHLQPKASTSDEKIEFSNTANETEEKNSNNKSSNAAFHVFNEDKQRCLLDELIEYDEEEDWRVNRIKTDEDLYLMWKCGETKKAHRIGTDTQYNKNNRDNKIIAGKSSNNQLLKKDSKLDMLCAWETVYNKKPAQKFKERKQRLSQPNYFYNGRNSNNEKTSPFTFFHYTDIARYIQQYRNNHICENSCAGCSQNSSQYQEVRDLNFPFKFDLTTGSIKNKLLGRGLDRNGSEHQQKRTVVVEDERLFKGSESVSGYLTPVGFRPPHTIKSPTIENWNSFPESPSRLRHHLKKIWRSYEQNRSSSPNNQNKRLPATSEGIRDNTAPMCKHTSSGSRKSDNATNKTKKSDDVSFVHQRCNSKLSDDVRQEQGVNQEDTDGPVKFREFTLDENCLQVKEDRHSVSRVSVDHFPVHDTLIKFIASPEPRQNESDKKRRMRSLITTEINNLQKKQVITIEQKRKLDKFKDALKTGQSEGRVDSKGTMTTLGDKISKRHIAGSVRAYYTRTATSGSLINTVRTRSVKCGPDLDARDKNDDKPIIYVTQPHLSQLRKKQHQSNATLKGKKLIGGHPVEKSTCHAADVKQFTRITDLLRMKERKQSGRHVVSEQRPSLVESAAHKKSSRDRNRSLTQKTLIKTPETSSFQNE